MAERTVLASREANDSRTGALTYRVVMTDPSSLRGMHVASFSGPRAALQADMYAAYLLAHPETYDVIGL